MNIILRSALYLVGVLALTNSSHAANYSIDPDHSSISFKVRHLAISSVHGRFTEFSGNFSYDPANVASSSATAKIMVKSINTQQAKRDEHLRSKDFFEADQFAEMQFVSKKVVPQKDGKFHVGGDLTIHGITRPVLLDVTFLGEAKDPWGKERAAFSAVARINRRDFGLTWSKVLETGALVVGDEVEIALEIEGIKTN